MEQEWSRIEGDVLGVLEREGSASPEVIALELGISEGEATVFICMLAREGKLRIRVVEGAGSERLAPRRAA